MLDSILADIFTNQWLVLLITTLLFIGLSEIGFRVGLSCHRAKDEAGKGQIGPIQGAILGLLGLLLGFSFAMAVGRYEARRTVLLQEANAIGTTFLRASFLPEPHRKAVEDLLRRYVDTRLDFYAAGIDPAKVVAAEKTAAGIQRELWAHTVAVAKESPSVLTPTFIMAVNETIDMDATRLDAMRAHVPGSVWVLVLMVAGVGCYATGYGAGVTGARTFFSSVLFPLLIAVVITLVADLDRPRLGLIRINQKPMLDLKASLSQP